MSNRVIFAEHVTALAATGIVAAGAVSAPFAAVAVPLGVIGTIGASIWRRCPKRNCDRAVKTVLAGFEKSPEVDKHKIDRALAFLNDRFRQVDFPPRLTVSAASAGGAEGFDRAMAQELLGCIGLDETNRDLHRLLSDALTAAVAACRRDPVIREKLTQDLLLEAARQNGVMLRILETTAKTVTETRAEVSKVGDKIDALQGQFSAVIENLGRSDRDQLEALASRFRIADAWELSDAELRRELEKKAEDWRALRAQFSAIPQELRALSGTLEAAQSAIEAGQLDEAEALLARAQMIQLEQAARTAEKRADQALLRGQVEQAFAMLTAAADSFAAVDPLEPARRRIQRYFTRLRDHGLRYGGTGIARALDMLSPVVNDELRLENAPLWATGKHAAGMALFDSGTRLGGPEGAALLGRAVQAYRDALAVHTRTAHPADWARVQNNLGSALRAQGLRIGGPEGTALLQQAVEAYHAALQVRSPGEHPTDWAATQNNLGNALQVLGERLEGDAQPQRAALLGQAVEAYGRALQVYTRSDHPLHWAMAQNNLGAALQAQGRLTDGAMGATLLGRAAEAFRAALAMRDRNAHPLRWASSQNNLGYVLAEQGARVGGAEGAGLLAQAIEAYEAALEVRIRAEHPVDWAETQENLALVEEARAHLGDSADPVHLRAALAHVERALEVYDPEHMPHDHHKASDLRMRILAALERAG